MRGKCRYRFLLLSGHATTLSLNPTCHRLSDGTELHWLPPTESWTDAITLTIVVLKWQWASVLPLCAVDGRPSVDATTQHNTVPSSIHRPSNSFFLLLSNYLLFFSSYSSTCTMAFKYDLFSVSKAANNAEGVPLAQPSSGTPNDYLDAVYAEFVGPCVFSPTVTSQ